MFSFGAADPNPRSGDGPPSPRLPDWAPPDDELPGVVDVPVRILPAGDVALAVGQVDAYTNGFQFTVHLFSRSATPDLGRAFSDHQQRESPQTAALRIGVRFGGGRVATNWETPPLPPFSTESRSPLLVPMGGHGFNRSFAQRYWVWPLPPSGVPVEISFEWGDRGLAETVVTFSGNRILEAAGRSVAVWSQG